MVLQQCLACNTMMHGTSRVCICGHVFDEIKETGGKRFSDYRAMLYNRLENRRIKSIMKEMKRSEVLGFGDEENTVNNKVTINHQETESVLQKKPYKVKKTHKRRKRKAHRHSPTSFQTTTLHRRHVRPIPAELIDRLPKALAEINRKLVGQNSMWSGL